MISAENISKSFGSQVLFEDLSFKINSRERVGLVGRNGHGKTTLFRMIIGKEQPDSGTLVFPKQYRIGYVRQHLAFTRETVLKEAMTGLPETERDHHWKAEKVLDGLGFSQEGMHRPPHTFSGGYQVRLNLAKVLVSEPDLLLLDEPTNYLDITSIRWIEQFLIRWPRELMVITHDRSFMDKVVTHVLGIHRKTARKIAGNTEKYYSRIAQDEEIYEKTRINDEKKRKEIAQFINRFRAKARLANLVQSRVKTLEKMEKRDRLEQMKALEFSFRSRPFPAKQVGRVSRLSFGYDPAEPLIRDFNITIGARERICVVGKNGKGKTTLLKLLAGALTPDAGEVRYHPAVVRGLFEQTNIKRLVDSRTVEEEVLYSDADVDQQSARNICGAMMFEGDAALKKISVLSGGEKSRVMLGKLLVTPVNLLLLDEPTNHLDMDSSDALLAAIDSFDGTVVMVTHNEMFLHALAHRLIVFQNDRIAVFDDTYGRFLEKGGWEESGGFSAAGEKDEPAEKTGQSKQTKKEARRKRSALNAERARILKPMQRRITQVENRIDDLEKEQRQLSDKMQAASEAMDGPAITDLSQALHTCQSAIDTLFDELETLTAEYEEQTALFEETVKRPDGEA